MKRTSIRWQLPASYAAIALLAALALGSVMLLVLSSYYANQERQYLLGNAEAVRSAVEQIFQAGLPERALADQVKGLAFLSQTQIRVLDSSGKVLTDSGVPDASQMVAVSAAPAGQVIVNVQGGDSLQGVFDQGGGFTASLPQVVQMGGGAPPGQADTILAISASPYGYGFVASGEISSRRSAQAISLNLAGPGGAVELSNGPAYGTDILTSVSTAWAAASLFAIALAGLAGWAASKQVIQPVLALTAATRRMEQGDLSSRASLPEGGQASEFRTLAHAFNGMAQRVDDTISTLRAFVSDSAHELNTPLTALQTNLELAVSEKDPAQKDIFLGRACQQVERMERLAGSLLDLSRIEAARHTPAFEEVNLAELSSQCAGRFAGRAEQAERSFSLALPGQALLMEGSPDQLQGAIDNLLENALKFTPPGGAITLDLERMENQAVLTVTDSGIGIPPDDLPHLFERFHRGRNAAAYPGSGLGLTIVRAVVEAHGGRVAAQSADPAGSQFTITLPIKNS